MRWKRAGRVLFTCFCVSMALGILIGLGAYAYIESQGSARKASRYGFLLGLRTILVRYAKEHGRYPGRIEDAVSYEIDDAAARERYLHWVGPDSLQYKASELQYDPSGNPLLFREKTPRRYGFETGWFKLYQDDAAFCEGRPSPKGP